MDFAKGNLTNGWGNRPKRTLNHREKHIFPRCFFFDFPEFSHFSIEFTPIFLPLCDTCDSKKTTLRLECARTYTCARETYRNLSFFFLSFLSFLFFCFHFFLCTLFSSLFSQIVFSVEVFFCKVRMSFYGLFKEKSTVFLDFFTLWGYFHPYTNRGNVMMEI